MIILLPLLIAIVGALMFGLCANGKLVEIGRLMFFAGLLAFLLSPTGPMISLIHR
jgi:hypothetical protein